MRVSNIFFSQYTFKFISIVYLNNYQVTGFYLFNLNDVFFSEDVIELRVLLLSNQFAQKVKNYKL